MGAVEPRYCVEKIIEFHSPGDTGWRFGKTRNVSRSGLLFSCGAYLPLGSLVYIRLADDIGDVSLHVAGQRRVGQVVRRVLMSWPDVVHLFGIRFVDEDPATQDENLV